VPERIADWCAGRASTESTIKFELEEVMTLIEFPEIFFSLFIFCTVSFETEEDSM
jgi:hypothetical protein